jgi:hypothetical protein
MPWPTPRQPPGAVRIISAARRGKPTPGQTNKNLSDSLLQPYGLWMSGKSITTEVGPQEIGRGYPTFSWYCIMSGMGIFPDRKDLRPANGKAAAYSMEETDNLMQRSVQNFRSKRSCSRTFRKKSRKNRCRFISASGEPRVRERSARRAGGRAQTSSRPAQRQIDAMRARKRMMRGLDRQYAMVIEPRRPAPNEDVAMPHRHAERLPGSL